MPMSETMTSGSPRSSSLRAADAELAHNTRALRFAAAGGFREELVSPRYAVIDGRAANRVRVVKFV